MPLDATRFPAPTYRTVQLLERLPADSNTLFKEPSAAVGKPAYVPLAGSVSIGRYLDSSISFKEALRRAFVDYRDVTLPSDSFPVDPGITAPDFGTISCSGKTARLVPNGLIGDVLTLGGYGVAAGVQVVSTGYRTAGAAINAKRAFSVVEDVYLERCFDGVIVEGTESRILNLSARDFAGGGANDVIRVQGKPFSVRIEGLRSDHPDVLNGHGPRSILHLLDTNDVTLSQFNLIRAGTACLLIDPGPGQIVATFYAIQGCFDTSPYGVLVQPRGGDVLRPRFNMCWSPATGGDGMRFDTDTGGGNITGVTVDTPDIPFAGQSGIAIVGAGTSGIDIGGSGQIAGAADAGVSIEKGASNVHLHGRLRIGQESTNPKRLNGNRLPIYADGSVGEVYVHSPVDLRLNNGPSVISGNPNVHINTPFV